MGIGAQRASNELGGRELRIELPVRTSVSPTVHKPGDFRAAQKQLHASDAVDVMSVGFSDDAPRLDVELQGGSNTRGRFRPPSVDLPSSPVSRSRSDRARLRALLRTDNSPAVGAGKRTCQRACAAVASRRLVRMAVCLTPFVYRTRERRPTDPPRARRRVPHCTR